MTRKKRTLLGELVAIDNALLNGTANAWQEKRGQELVALADAAPDMCDALDGCLQLCDDLYANMADPEEVVIWDKARAAFAKASTRERGLA